MSLSRGEILQIDKAVLFPPGDLKPENLLFTTKDDDAVLKLTDFGFAKEGKEVTEERRFRSEFSFVGNNEQRPLNTPW